MTHWRHVSSRGQGTDGMAIKRDAADDAFSLCVRERANWTCEACGKVDIDGQTNGRSATTDCAHIHGRRSRNVRWCSDNALCLCKSCHRKFTEQPIEFARLCEGLLGSGRLEMLRDRYNDLRIKYTANDRKDIAAHYRAEYRRMREERRKGGNGRIEFAGYD